MKITRRGLLISAGIIGGGVLIGALGVGGYIASYDELGQQRAIVEGTNLKMVAQFLTITPDNVVTVIAPTTEMGQGSQTSILQIVLDELDADPAKTRFELAPADPAFAVHDAIASLLLGAETQEGFVGTFVERLVGRVAQLGGLQFTGGSTGTKATGWRGVRRAAALARMRLAEVGADRLGVSPSEVTTRDSHVVHEASGRKVSYGELADTVAGLPLPSSPTYKAPETYRFIGTRHPRFDIPEKVFGDPVYGMDVEVQGMRFAAVAPPPLAQGRVTGVRNEAAVRARRGVEAIVIMEDAVAVVADNPWRAEQAARALEIVCEAPEGGPLDGAALFAARVEAAASASGGVASEGDGVSGTLSGADVHEATYTTPHYAHAPMEPLNCTVWEEAGKVHVATGVQGPLAARNQAASALGRSFGDVVLHAKTMGGGFGRRNGLMGSSLNYVRQACEIHNAVGGAVKLIWSREAGLRMSSYHPADVGHMQARLGADGYPTHWLARQFYAVSSPAEAIPAYRIPNLAVRSANGTSALPYGFWRSVDAFCNTLFIESFVDELAERADIDPVAYRLAMLEGQPRHQRVLKTVAQQAGWKGRRVGDKGYGVAFVEAFGTLVAVVAEVSLVRDQPRVHQVWCAVDCGLPINPGSVEAQAQGGIFWGVSAALYGRTDFENGAMVQSNFHNYRVATFRDAPLVHVEILTSPGAEVGGMGEATTPPTAPAIANAIAALTDRPRNFPLLA